MEKDQTPRPLVAGYVVVLLGVAGWLAGCLLPLYEVGNGPSTGYRLYTNVTQGPASFRTAQAMNLFGGVAAILVICVLGLRSRSAKRWVEGALLGAVVAWTFVSSSLLLTIATASLTPEGFSKALGYWCLVSSVVVTVLGTIMVVVAARRADARAAHAAPEMIRYQIPPSAPGGGGAS